MWVGNSFFTGAKERFYLFRPNARLTTELNNYVQYQPGQRGAGEERWGLWRSDVLRRSAGAFAADSSDARTSAPPTRAPEALAWWRGWGSLSGKAFGPAWSKAEGASGCSSGREFLFADCEAQEVQLGSSFPCLRLEATEAPSLLRVWPVQGWAEGGWCSCGGCGNRILPSSVLQSWIHKEEEKA